MELCLFRCPVPRLGLGAVKPTPRPTNGPSPCLVNPRVTTPNSKLSTDVSTHSPTLDQGATTPSYLLGLGRELSPASLRLGVKLKSHSTLSPLYPEPELIIMMPIIIPLKTNKQPMLILIRRDGLSSKIILFYYYKITSISLLCCIKQVKSGNTKGSMNIQEKWGEKNFIL